MESSIDKVDNISHILKGKICLKAFSESEKCFNKTFFNLQLCGMARKMNKKKNT